MSRQGEKQERTLVNVKEFWNKEAAEWGDNPQVTIRDHYLRLLEIELISGLIAGRKYVLDMGCGTGFATLFYAQKVGTIVGADFAEKMVAAAKRFNDDPAYYEQTMQQYALDGAPTSRGHVRFEQGDITDIKYPANTFDGFVSQRVLINLPQVGLQDKAVVEVARVMQSGGLWASVEVSQQGHSRMDEIRTAFGLPILEKYWHNLYIDEPHFEASAKTAGFEVNEVRRFETYQFLTKVMHPLVVAPEEPKFLAGFNDAARQVSREFPTYDRVAKVGLGEFLKSRFRPLVEKLDSGKLAGFDRVTTQIIKAGPDFTGCSHQVVHILTKR
jgi:ubiquinone/menaquinone biosynthesis C-methylase UbiE